MSNIVKEIQQSLSENRNIPQWYNNEVKDMLQENKKILKTSTTPEVGKMFLFMYDPKLKDVLPFYDIFPLVVPIRFNVDGFLGLNLHYLPPMARASLLNNLMSVANNTKYDDSTKININYELLQSSRSKFIGYKECIKRYLYGHVRTTFHSIESKDWSKVVLLPLQKWQVNSNMKYSGNPPY